MDRADDVYCFLSIVCSLKNSGSSNSGTAILELKSDGKGGKYLCGKVILNIISRKPASEKFKELKNLYRDVLTGSPANYSSAAYELADRIAETWLKTVTGSIYLHPCFYNLDNYDFVGSSVVLIHNFGDADTIEFSELIASLKTNISRDFSNFKITESENLFQIS